MSLALVPYLAAYIPRDRVESILSKRPLSHDGVALIADISGFTKLTEVLTKNLQADQGAEELTRTLESVFKPLIAEVHQFQGSVIKFGGDALIVWFGREKYQKRKTVLNKALTSAVRMQDVMAKHGRIQTPIGPVILQMKIGLAYGPVKRFNLGEGGIGFEDVLAGNTLDLMADAEHQAEPGDIAISRASYPIIQNQITIKELRNGYPILENVRRHSLPTPWSEIKWEDAQTQNLAEELASYVPQQIYDQLRINVSRVAELRPVVSLFVQFHGLLYDVDPAIDKKLQTYFTSSQQIVSRYNGRLNRLITGDKGSMLHIIFGAPRTVEEQETRALRCALDLQYTAKRLPFISMQRIGIAAGRVFAGPVGSDERHDYTTMGDTINLSARLMQNASDNQILVETAVTENAKTIIAEKLTPIFVKGKAEPIPVSMVLEHRQTPHTRRETPQLFGRQEELSLIRNRLSQLNQGKGSVSMIIGEVGLGKSLLLDTVRMEMEKGWVPQKEGGILASGLSVAYGESISGYLFINLLRDLIDVQPGSGPSLARKRLIDFCTELFGVERLEATFPYLARFMNLPLTDSAAQRLDGLGGESLRWQIFELIPELLEKIAQNFPLILLFDDLQWSDPTSLQLIERILPLVEKRPLMVILATRPTQFDFSDSSKILHIVLKPIDDKAAGQIIQFHAPKYPQNVVQQLITRGEGNPLFLVELARTLKNSLISGNAIDEMTLDSLNLPDSVQGLLLAQIDRLEADARNTIQMASVIGKTFLDRVLHFISNAEQEILEQLLYLEQKDYIYPTTTADFGSAHIFRHGLVQETAYSTLLFERRREYHRRVAEALDQLFPTAVFEQASFLAHHYEQANEVENAIYYLQMAADQSRLLFAHAEAEKLYNRTISLIQQNQPEQTLELAKIWLKLAQVNANQADYNTAQIYYEKAFNALDSEQDEIENETLLDVDLRPFRWGLIAHDESFDPAVVQSGEYTEIIQNIFEGLIEVDYEWNIIPAVASRWEINQDGLIYRFQIREGLKWSDQHPLTAHDFVHAFQRLFNPKTKSDMAVKLHVIKGAKNYHTGQSSDPTTIGIQAINDYLLQIELESPSLYFLYLLAEPIAFPAPKHIEDDSWYRAESFVGNGAYLLQKKAVSKTVPEKLRLTINDYYRKRHPKQLPQIELEPIEPSIEHYNQNKIDWCRVEKLSDFNDESLVGSKMLIQGFVTYFLAFSCHQEPFNNTALRQAFAMSIDKEALVQESWSGMPKPARGGMLPPGMPGHSPEISLRFSPDEANEIISRYGWGHLKEIKLVSITGFGETPEFLQKSWANYLGIDVAIEKDAPIGDSLQAIKSGEVQMLLLGISMGNPGPENILSLVNGNSPLNYWGWQNHAYDELLAKTLASSNLTERLKNYHDLDQIIVQDSAVLIPLYYQQAYGVIQEEFRFSNTVTRIRDQRLNFKNLRLM